MGILSKKNIKIFLPFAVPAKERFKPFTKDMEMAAIFYLAENDRKKSEGRVLKKSGEKIMFIAETCYPLWLIPWKGRTLILDGLNLTNQSLSYDVLPDTKAFENDIQTSSQSREAYCAALCQHVNYFQNFAGKEEKVIEGLIKNSEFIQDLMDYLQDAEGAQINTLRTILDPTLDDSEVSVSIDEFSNLRDILDQDIRNLCRIMKLLSKSTKEKAKALNNEIKKSEKEFERQIRKVKPKVMAKIKKIQEKRDKEVTRISKKYDGKLHIIHQKRIKTAKKIERLSCDVDRIEADIKAAREHKDEASEFQLSQKLDEIKKQLPVLNKEIKNFDKEIENVQDSKKIVVARARSKPDDQVEEAMMTLRDIEAAKEAKIKVKQQELENLDEKTTVIINQINTMVKSKEIALSEIDSIGAELRRRKNTLAYITVYFVCYENEAGKRYVVYPPSYVNSMGIKTKLKGVFGAGKMKSFLQSRSEPIQVLVDQLVDLIQNNPVFEKEITEAEKKANILQTTELKEKVKKGLTELRDDKWISDNEYQNLNSSL